MHKTYHTKPRLVVGIHSAYLVLRCDPESIEDASRKHSGVLCCFCLLHIDLFSSTEMCGSLFQNKLISSAADMVQILFKGDSLYTLLSKCFFLNYLISSNKFCSDPSSFYLKHE